MKYLSIILIALLLIIGTETFIKFKKEENKKIEDVRKSLIIRIDIIMVITVLLAIVTIINILIKK